VDVDKIHAEGNEMDTKTTKRKLITRAAYAKIKGVAPRTIGKYTQKGIIPLHDNKVDPVEADKILKEILVQPLGSGKQKGNTGKSQDGMKTIKVPAEAKVIHKPTDVGDYDGPAVVTFVDARTREKLIKVELLELDLKLKKGETVLVKDVEFAAFTSARQVRDRMLNIPDRICAEVAAEPDEVKVRNIIIAQIENELRALSEEKITNNG
jgi:phage terminase Nu1 subunit (DNA packaging protein)